MVRETHFIMCNVNCVKTFSHAVISQISSACHFSILRTQFFFEHDSFSNNFELILNPACGIFTAQLTLIMTIVLIGLHIMLKYFDVHILPCVDSTPYKLSPRP